MHNICANENSIFLFFLLREFSAKALSLHTYLDPKVKLNSGTRAKRLNFAA